MKKISISLILLITVLSVAGCSNKALDAAKIAIDGYNDQVAIYNEAIAPYNDVLEEIEAKNQELQEAANAAQDVINKGETPFDEETLIMLKDTMSAAIEAKVEVPEKLAPYTEITIDEKAKREDFEKLTTKAIADTETMVAFTMPELPTVPEFSSVIQSIADARLAYEDSVQGLKQLTAPSDEFVMERLQLLDTISAMDAVTEDHDPNGKLNKQGGYIGCVYFRDTQVDWSKLYIESGKDSVIDVGCDGGGALEIFKTVKEAQVRDTYLGGFDGTAFASGSHYIYGTIIVRTSNELSGTKQLELTDKIIQALTRVEH